MKTTRRAALVMLGTLPAAVAEAQGRKKRPALPSRRRAHAKLGILYPYTLTPAMQQAILTGWGSMDADSFAVRQQTGTELANIGSGITQLVNDEACDVFVALGGLHVHETIVAYRKSLAAGDRRKRIPFYTMIGRPAREGSVGGQALNTSLKLPERIAHLLAKVEPGFDASSVSLYRHPTFAGPAAANARSSEETFKVRGLEFRQWTDPATWPPTKAPRGPNYRLIDFNSDAGSFAESFRRIDPQVRAIVVSACPYFTGNMSALVAAANDWLGSAGPTKYIIYPFAEYLATASAPGTQSFAYGPRLTRTRPPAARPGPLQKLGAKAKVGTHAPHEEEEHEPALRPAP
jgi:hypothetical protein